MEEALRGSHNCKEFPVIMETGRQAQLCLRGPTGLTKRPFGDHLETIWGPFGDHLGTIWGPFGDHLGTIVMYCTVIKEERNRSHAVGWVGG